MGSTPENGEAKSFPHLGYSRTVKVSEPWTVEKVVEAIPDAPAPGASTPLPFFHMLGRLKTTKREGWRRFGIDRGESIADHMYRMSLISMFAPAALRPRLDISKCIKMSLVHDMAELLVGDITPVDGVPKPEKNRRETATMDYLTGAMLRNVPGGAADGEELRAVWQEYEDSKTLDSHFVHDVDKIELLLQMVEYEKAGKGQLDLGEFTYVATKVVLPEMKAWADDVVREREEFWGGVAHLHGEKGLEGGISAETKSGQDEYYGKG